MYNANVDAINAETKNTASETETGEYNNPKVLVSSGDSALNDKNKTNNTLAYTLASNIIQISDMDPVFTLTGKELNNSSMKLSEQIRSFFNSIGNKVFRKNFGEVSFGEYGIGGVLNHRPVNRAKIISLAAVPEVIKNGKQIGYDSNWKERGYESFIFAAPVLIEGYDTPVYVAAVVDRRPDNKFYVSEMVDSNGNYVRIKESPSDNSKSGVDDGGNQNTEVDLTALPKGLIKDNALFANANPATSSTNNITQHDTSVKPDNAESPYTVKYNSGPVTAENFTPETQKFNEDVSKYTGRARDVVQKAINSGILNNSEATHRMVDMVAKISNDKGIEFVFANNAMLEKMGFKVNGRQVNGVYTANGIYLNVDSPVLTEHVIGHEITHVLEGTKFYDELQRAITKYAQMKGGYTARIGEVQSLYDGVENSNIYNEVTAELVGEYLFTDEGFVNNLAVTNKNLFQRIWDEIKYISKLLTAGSPEARQLKRVKHTFEKAYNSSNVNNTGEVRYALTQKDVRDLDINWDPDNFSTLKEQLIAHLDEVNSMQPVVDVTYSKQDKRPYYKVLEDTLKNSFGNKIDVQGLGSILFDEGAISSIKNYVETDAERAAAIAAPYVIKKGKIISGHKNHKGQGTVSITFAAPAILNNKRGNVVVSVMFGKGRVHSLRVLSPEGKAFELLKTKDTESTTEKISSTMGRSDNATVDPYINSMSENMITSPDGNVNNNFSLSTQNHTSTGTQGTPLNSLQYNPSDSSAALDEISKNTESPYTVKYNSGPVTAENFTPETQKFNEDVSKYTGRARDVVQKAINSGILNNSEATHRMVDMVAKISNDKGIEFVFANNAMLSRMGFKVNGRQVNGVYTANGIYLNVDSPVLTEHVIGHEITHALEGTKFYDELQRAITKYAQMKGGYTARIGEVQSLYDGVENSNIYNEVTAELVGEYLFTDEGFVNNLAVNNKNLFQRIWDEIKYISKLLTAGSPEARQLERVKHIFEKAYNSSIVKNVGEGEAKYNIVFLDDGKTYVEASRNVIQGKTKAEQKNDIRKFFDELLNNTPFLDIHTIEGDILTITKDETEYKAEDEDKSVRSYKIKMSPEEFSLKLRAESHIDELAEVSTKQNRPRARDYKNHHFAKDGFSYRRAYFRDFDGKYYKISFSVGHNGTIATIYNVGKIIEDELPSANIIAVVGSKPLTNPSSTGSIYNKPKNVNNNFSLSHQNYTPTGGGGRSPAGEAVVGSDCHRQSFNTDPSTPASLY